jgi:hypothetical protein
MQHVWNIIFRGHYHHFHYVWNVMWSKNFRSAACLARGIVKVASFSMSGMYFVQNNHFQHRWYVSVSKLSVTACL